MRVLIAYILLFFYTVTCSGATVYMHFCHGTSDVSIQGQSLKERQNCTMCLQHKGNDHNDQMSHTCDLALQTCCKDITLELKKSDNEAENTAAIFSFFNLAPAITTIYWISIFQNFIVNPDNLEKTYSEKPLVAYKPPTYLFHCNFRI